MDNYDINDLFGGIKGMSSPKAKGNNCFSRSYKESERPALVIGRYSALDGKIGCQGNVGVIGSGFRSFGLCFLIL
jgi:hypothetical protein